MSTSNSNDPISGANSLLIGDAESDSPLHWHLLSTLYDEICKGCGRTLIEVSNWVFMTPEEKAAVWQRIQREGTAVRFQRNKAE